MSRRTINRVGSKIIKKTFLFWEKVGFHVTPNHYYQPIPDTRTLKDHLWSKTTELVGVDLNDKKQLELLSLFVSNFRSEYDKFPKNITSAPHRYYVNNDFFGSVDGEILYCMIRYFKPRKIFEIGSGYSTCLSAQAILENRVQYDDYDCKLTSFEPYPNEILKAGFPGLYKLVPKKVQDIDLLEFKKLQKNDVLFIDSSHVLKIGSDVQYEYLDILPRLNKGVIVHLHDIFLPSEYPKEWVLNDFKFWTEQYVLQAFLAFNESFEILWAGNYMHTAYPEKLENSFCSYTRDKERPASFWIRKIK